MRNIEAKHSPSTLPEARAALALARAEIIHLGRLASELEERMYEQIARAATLEIELRHARRQPLITRINA